MQKEAEVSTKSRGDSLQQGVHSKPERFARSCLGEHRDPQLASETQVSRMTLRRESAQM